MAPSALVEHKGKTPLALSKDCKKMNLLLDMGGVLLKWDGGASGLGGLVNPKLVAHMLQDSIWSEYETGKLESEEAYEELSQKFGVPAGNIRSAAGMALERFAPVPEIVNIVNENRGKLRIFGMTNVPAQEFEYLHKKFPEIWENFEKVFTSADAGMRKPNLEFYRHVLQEAGINPRETVFVDDTLENCVAANSLGITAVLCERIKSAVQELNFVLRSEEERLLAARRYLDRVVEHDRHDLETVSNNGARLTDGISEFYIADVLDDARFLPTLSVPENGELCYTRNTDTYKWILFPLPNDLDTTSVGMSVLYSYKKVSLDFINSVVNNMLNYTASLEFLYNVLLNKGYLEGSVNHIGPAPFLYFLSKIAARFRENHFLPSDFIPLLTERVQEAMGMQPDHLAIAMTILACLNLRIDPDDRDVENLARAQNADGSWDMAYWFKANVLVFGCKALTTAFALSALQRVHDLRNSAPPSKKRKISHQPQLKLEQHP